MTAARLLPRRVATETLDPLVRALVPRRDDRLLGKAVLLAIVLHVPLVFLRLPETESPPPAPIVQDPTITLVDIPLPPPKLPDRPPERPPARDPRALLPVPFPDDASDPIDESVALDRAEVEAHFSVADAMAPPEAPPVPDGPLEVFAAGVTAPVAIADCRVEPTYPELARAARRPGKVYLRAVIRADGTVGDAEVLSARPPGLGFEQAALDAVLQWCYEPATYLGRPIDVYFTIQVTFELY